MVISTLKKLVGSLADAADTLREELSIAMSGPEHLDHANPASADELAQTAVSVAACSRLVEHITSRDTADNLLATFGLCGILPQGVMDDRLHDILDRTDIDAVLREFDTSDGRTDPIIDLYERFLEKYDAAAKSRRGVFFTPRPIVSFIVRCVDDVLRDEFDLEHGLADTTTWGQMAQRQGLLIPKDVEPEDPFVQILDPATGTGAFLVEVIRCVYRTQRTRWKRQGCDGKEMIQRWNDFVSEHLLARLHGYEILMAPHAVAKLSIGLALVETGYRFESAVPIHVRLASALEEPVGDRLSETPPRGTTGAVQRTCLTSVAPSATVILGNPPFSGISHNRNGWIEGLLKGRLPDGTRVPGYYDLDGQPLGEKKLWLQDDYVKFIRLAQWHVERTGCGVVGYVSNHGYLDNITFRGMRQRMLEAFSRITLVDLHGNVKKHERHPDGGADENVFDIETGVAVGLFRRTPNSTGGAASVEHRDLWGTRQEKYNLLLQGSLRGRVASELIPSRPFYFFVPRDEVRRNEYEQGFRLADIMPVHSTAVVTARDGFVIALDRDELVDRLSVFRDLSIPDATIRQRYFRNTRSSRYPPGDTRGWRLTEARQRLAADPDWQRHIRTCLYRPFDRRFIFWADWMVDWPRPGVTRHLVGGDNVALVARRQMLPSGPCNFFWLAGEIAIDGVIRSDNRGSESLFPLYLKPDPLQEDESIGLKANFHPEFIEAVTKVTGFDWLECQRGDLQGTIGPEDLLNYIYAQFHSPGYRTRFAEQLRSDFARVFLTEDVDVFRQQCALGGRLVAVHTDGHPAASTGASLQGSGPTEIARGYPKFENGQVSVNRDRWFAHVPEPAWEFCVGAHQVCRKFLKDRRGRTLAQSDIDHYGRIVWSVCETIRLMDELKELESAGRFATS